MAARVLQVMMTGALLVAVMGCGSSSVDSPASAGPRPHLLIVAQDPSGVYEVDSLALGQRQTLVRLGVLDRAAFSADQRGVAFIDDRGRRASFAPVVSEKRGSGRANTGTRHYRATPYR